VADEPEAPLVTPAMFREIVEALEGVTVMSAVRDAEGTIVDFRFEYLNPAARRMLGDGEIDVVGHTSLELFPSIVELGMFDGFRRVVETGEPRVAERWFEERKVRGWFEATSTRFGDGYLTVTRNISKRKAAQAEGKRATEAEANAELRLRLLADNASDVVCFSGPDRLLQWVSPSVTAALGWAPADLVGTVLGELAHPEDRAPAESSLSHLYSGVTADPAAARYLMRLRTKAGEYRWISGLVTPVHDDGSFLGVVSGLRDVDELVRAREAAQEGRSRLQAISDSLFDPHMLMLPVRDDGGSIIDFVYADVNDAACVFLRRDREQLVGSRMSDLFPGQLVSDLWPLYVALIESGTPLISDARPYRSEVDGQTRRIDARGVRIGGAMSLTWRDITESFNATEQREQVLRAHAATLAAANRELTRAAQVKDEFLATMSHELRAPLATILALTETLRSGLHDPLTVSQANALATVETNSDHLLALINDLLDLSRIDAQPVELMVAPIVPAELCEGVVQLTAQRAEGRDLTLAVTDTSAIGSFRGDQRRITQVLVNLVDNAIKFTEPGGAIGLDVRRASETHLTLTVWDTGIGIDPADFGRMFERFTQLDAGLDRHYAGTGLGLALVERLVALHSGSVAVESAPGAGSRFTVTLPIGGPRSAGLAAVPPATAGTNAPAEPTAGPGDGATDTPTDGVTDRVSHGEPAPPVSGDEGRRRVLLVEDSPEYAEIVCEYLAAQGHIVHWLGDAAALAAEAAAFAPDVVLMDIQMPGIDGLEAMRQLRDDANLAPVRIVVVTGLAMPGDRERCLAAGADAYLPKPSSLKEIRRLVEASDAAS